MKQLTIAALVGAFLVTSTSTFAARDETLIRQIEKTAAAKREAQAQLAKQQQSSFAGAVGQTGKVGPTSDQTNSRPGRRTLADHP
jgi:hypothetical protein